MFLKRPVQTDTFVSTLVLAVVSRADTMNKGGPNRRLMLAAVAALLIPVSGCIDDWIPDRPDLSGYDVMIPDSLPFDLPPELPGDAIGDGPTCPRNCYERVCGPDGCGGTCGTCPAGTVCSLDYSICLVTDVLRPAGSICGQNAVCEPRIENPVYPGTYYDNPDWPACTGYQCRGLVCDQGICSAACTISVDQVVNGTDVMASDGIEDQTAGSNCPEFTGAAWSGPSICVSRGAVFPGEPAGVCVPWSSMAPCNPGSECGDGEYCGYIRIGSAVERRCLASIPGGAATGSGCGYDKPADRNTVCESGTCFSDWCTRPCDSDEDCTLSDSRCQAGLCEGSGRVCSLDSDCSPLVCGSVMVDRITVRGCVARTCSADRDCPGDDLFCRPEVASLPAGPSVHEGRCRPATRGGEPVGSPCGPDLSGGVRVCRNTDMCVDGVCTSTCDDDLDCFVQGPLRCAYRDRLYLSGYLGIPVWLRSGLCLMSGYQAEGCHVDDDCSGASCTPWVGGDRDAPEVITTCMKPVGESWPIGTACGDLANGNACSSGYCFGQDLDLGRAGWCSQVCSNDSDCPELTYMGTSPYTWVCGGLPILGGLSPSIRDDLFASWCVPVDASSSLENCSEKRECRTTGQTCMPLLRAGPPAPRDFVDYVCVARAGAAADGSLCDISRDGSDCASRLCVPTATGGVGFCSRTCADSADCAVFGDVVSCDAAPIGRSRAGDVLTADICRMTGDCVVCEDDSDCDSLHRCANVAASWWYQDLRCVRICSSDSDCAQSAGTVCSRIDWIMSASGDTFDACMTPVCG